jgi:hypothetical protein
MDVFLMKQDTVKCNGRKVFCLTNLSKSWCFQVTFCAAAPACQGGKTFLGNFVDNLSRCQDTVLKFPYIPNIV